MITERIEIEIPQGMKAYMESGDPETALVRNAMILYPYILGKKISHGRAANILGIRKSDLIDLYAGLGFYYLDQTMDELEDDLVTISRFFDRSKQE